MKTDRGVIFDLELVAAGIAPFPDGLELLRRTDGWRVALATGSMRHEAEIALGPLGIRERFRAFVTRGDCVHGKPHPEPFLRAAAGLGVSPARCVAIEDAPGGIQAAKAAPMACVAATHSCARERLLGADLVVDDLGSVHLRTLVPVGECQHAG